ncbi:iron-sulfur cluster assembly scaffold protein [Novosphingobium sp. Rr 2-17]|uniref:iron-sulfur cluster assembly scaffold protein n=1 Tax=Novosphingobium sp. Rr 2-17 TaxID=555793 RepID=UPI000306B81C|nr:iron-sulfur cluster assembly scaffold protein [Novosphingobium sp. Rr 2-17]
MSAAVLYTPEVLALAIELARNPLTQDLPHRGEARSASCGSTITLGLATDDEGRLSRIGVRSQACAIGQASAALFVSAAKGRTPQEVEAAGQAVADWLSGKGDLPDWPGLAPIAAARDYPARHGAVLLPWKAAAQALSLHQAEG